MKIVTKILAETVQNLSPPQARKNHFIWMGLLYGALGPGTTCWPGGGSEMLYRGGGQKMASRGVRPVIYPPPRTPMPGTQRIKDTVRCAALGTEVPGQRQQQLQFITPKF